MVLMSEESFPHSLLGMVHLTNKIEQFGPLMEMTSVDAKLSLSDSYIYHEKGLAFTATSEILDSKTKAVLWRNEILMLQKSKSHSIPDGEALYESRIKEADVCNLDIAERWNLSSNMGRKYALASGDYNPIHLSAASASLFGFKQGAIMHGMWTKARSLAAILPHLDFKYDNKEVYSSEDPISDAYVEFKTPLILPGEVSLLTGTLDRGNLSGNVLSAKKGNRKNMAFEVKSTSGEQLPHLRGMCSWKA